MENIMQPIGKYVTLEEIKTEQVLDGIVIPDIVNNIQIKFKVVQVGTGQKGFEFPVKIGDIVMATRSDSTTTKTNGKNTLQVKVEKLIAKFDSVDDYIPSVMFNDYVLIYPARVKEMVLGGIVVASSFHDSPRFKVYLLPRLVEGLSPGDIILTENVVIHEVEGQEIYTTKINDISSVIEEPKE